MERLAPEDIQSIVADVTSNRDLISTIVTQLRETIQSSSPATQVPAYTPTNVAQHVSDQVTVEDQHPAQTTGGSQNTSHQADPSAASQSGQQDPSSVQHSQQEVPLPSRGWSNFRVIQ